jgi:hypothetical protein
MTSMLTSENFAKMAAQDKVEDVTRWIGLTSSHRLRVAWRYLQALRTGRETTTPFPEAQHL